jgi:hypothetical protein
MFGGWLWRSCGHINVKIAPAWNEIRSNYSLNKLSNLAVQDYEHIDSFQSTLPTSLKIPDSHKKLLDSITNYLTLPCPAVLAAH